METPESVTKAQLKARRKNEKLIARKRNINRLCPFIIEPFPAKDSGDSPTPCPYSNVEGGCRYSHDLEAARLRKPADIPGPCPVLSANGRCPNGLLCRWASGHSVEFIPADARAVNTEEACLNCLQLKVKRDLFRRAYNFDRSYAVVKTHQPNKSESAPVENGGTECLGIGAREKRKIDFSNKLFLAPMETLGNLPFRRLCKRLGADVTCSEMAIATNLLQGKQSEWALLRRHQSEDIFGVQICGSHVDTLTKAAQLIDENCQVDFVDINCGCPIDLVWKKGSGAGLLQHATRLESMVRSMDAVLRGPVVTVKMRTGVKDGRNLAHQLIPGVQRAGAALVTVHGRSREQRYTRLADWDYIKECCDVAKPGLLFGNGDIFSYEDYQRCKDASGVAGVMIARGALIKPWIFTEIRECRTWDISASERFDLLRDFTNYGLELWGSDARGVETTRHFLLEWLSFFHRYVPYGLQEVPQRLNDRPPAFVCRSDLETVLSSPKSSDWIEISKMLLGPVPDQFSFTPKHKANAF